MCGLSVIDTAYALAMLSITYGRPRCFSGFFYTANFDPFPRLYGCCANTPPLVQQILNQKMASEL